MRLQATYTLRALCQADGAPALQAMRQQATVAACLRFVDTQSDFARYLAAVERDFVLTHFDAARELSLEFVLDVGPRMFEFKASQSIPAEVLARIASDRPGLCIPVAWPARDRADLRALDTHTRSWTGIAKVCCFYFTKERRKKKEREREREAERERRRKRKYVENVMPLF